MAATRTSTIFRFLCGTFLAFTLADGVVVPMGESLGLWAFPGDSIAPWFILDVFIAVIGGLAYVWLLRRFEREK